MSHAPPSGTSPPSPDSAASPLRLLVAIGVGLGFAVGVTLLVRYSELVTGRYVSSGVPPVLAFAAAVLLSVTRPLLRRLHPALAVTRPQVLLVYAMLTLVVVLHSPYVVRAFLPHLTSLDYGSMRQPALRRFTEYLPAWWGPGLTGRDPEVVRTYFEGYRPGGVPWEAWLAPLALWFLFFLAIFVATGCLMTLLHHQWIHSERLGFPLLYLPLAVTQEGGALGAGGLGPIFRQPLMWVGFAVAAGFNGINIAHALWPAVPAPGGPRRGVEQRGRTVERCVRESGPAGTIAGVAPVGETRGRGRQDRQHPGPDQPPRRHPAPPPSHEVEQRGAHPQAQRHVGQHRVGRMTEPRSTQHVLDGPGRTTREARRCNGSARLSSGSAASSRSASRKSRVPDCSRGSSACTTTSYPVPTTSKPRLGPDVPARVALVAPCESSCRRRPTRRAGYAGSHERVRGDRRHDPRARGDPSCSGPTYAASCTPSTRPSRN